MIGIDGGYSFTFKTKEELSDKTGDFYAALGLEGANNTILVDTFLAPAQTYQVEFKNAEGEIIDTQRVLRGERAVAPSAPEKEGYTFVGWDDCITNIQSDTTVQAVYDKNKYTVIFVDWDQADITIKEFEHSDVLTSDTVPAKQGSIFDHWENELGEPVTEVTSNMIVTAAYTDAVYEVTYLDWNGDVLKTQKVNAGEQAEAPEISSPPESKKVFSSWSQPQETKAVYSNLTVNPIAAFKETAEAPEISVLEYTEEENAVINISAKNDDESPYFFVIDETEYMNISDGIDEEYVKSFGEQSTDSVSLQKGQLLAAYALADEKNMSEPALYYLSQIPEDDNTDYPVELLDITSATVSGIENKTYTGKEQTQNISVVYNGWTLENGTDYHVSYKNNKEVGTATVTISGIGIFTGVITKTFKISKAATLKKKNQSVSVAKALTISKEKGYLNYKLAKVSKSKFKKYFKVDDYTGTITAKKGLKKGTYKVKIKVIDSGGYNYKKASKTVTVTVKVK